MISIVLPQLSAQVGQHPIRSALVVLLILPITYVIVNEFVRRSRRIKGFDGPPNWPLVGNIPDIRINAAEKYRQWAQTYGDVYQIQLGNEPVIVVNSAAAAKKLFAHTSQALSSRPVFWTFHKVLSNTAGTTIGTAPFSESLKRRRKAAASALNKPSVATYTGHLDLETRDFIKDGLEEGQGGRVSVDPMPMIQRLALSLSLTLNWGTRMSTRDDLFHEIITVEETISKFRSTTSNLQDYIPILRLNPFSFGTRKAKEVRDRRDAYLTRLNGELDARIAQGTHQPCIQANVILDKEAALTKAELTSISLTMLSGGLDTVTTVVQWTIALLAQRPDIQAAAYAAIRAHYPPDQLPLCDPEDDQKVGYVVALVKEALRYFTVLRLSLPRAATKDIVYDGRTIPAGSTVYLNSWACNMDPTLFPSPLTFSPDRYLQQPDLPHFTFGLGYRMCAGSLLAARELYLVFLRLLAGFEIAPDDEGADGGMVDAHPLTGVSDPTTLVTMCRHYKVFLRPRDERALRGALGVGLGEGKMEG